MSEHRTDTAQEGQPSRSLERKALLTLLLRSVWDLTWALLIAILVSTPIFALGGELRTTFSEQAQFATPLADDGSLERWLRKELPSSSVAIRRSDDGTVHVDCDLPFNPFRKPPPIPWATLGYQGYMKGRSSRGMAVLVLPKTLLVLLLCAQAGFLIVALRRRRQERRARLSAAEWFAGPAGRAALIGGGAGVALFAFGWLHDLAASALLGRRDPGIWGTLSVFPWWISLLVAGCGSTIAPACEEVFFRGSVFASFDRAGHRRAAWIVSALAFAAAHFDPGNSIFYVVAGLLCAYLYLRCRTLVAPMVAHAVNNAAAFAVILAQRQ